MRKEICIAVFFFLFFISWNISGQQNTINPDSSPKTESAPADPKPVITNDQVAGPANPGNIVKDNENTVKVLPNPSKNGKTEDSKSANLKIETDAKKTEQKPLPVVKPVPDKPINGNGLIEINDGDFKYKRIPGISLNIEKPVEKSATDRNNESKLNETKDLPEADNKKEQQVFGIKKSTAVIILLIILIGIIIVFKIRSKTMGGKNVLKRFPGMK